MYPIQFKMLKNLKNKIKKNVQIVGFIFLITITVVSTSYFNYRKNINIGTYNNFIDNIYFKKTLSHLVQNLDPKYKKIKHKIKSGETFDKILEYYSIEKTEIIKIKNSLKNKVDLNKLNTKQIIQFNLDKTNNKITEFVYQTSNTQKIFLKRNIENDKFKEEILLIKLDKKIMYKENKILQSLYKSATDQSIPANTIIEFARIYGFQVDFQRDIWKNDSFQIIYEKYINEKDELIKTGNILYANLNLQGRQLPLYLFKINKDEEHYDESGQSIKKTLMKTPINGARLSSSFGKRKHPILGFTKMHLGTDFAAPTGTPIMASGDGKVIKVGWCGGGGNCVKIKHNSIYSTVYAHMSKFARGMKKGKVVRQGQIIGFVGSTGMSTGPHLHYEVIENGRKINSQKLKLPSGKILKGKDRENFEINKLKIKVLKSNLIVQDS